EDTGVLVGVSEAAPDISFARMMERQQALADVLLADPDVATVASFIGADGTNATTNSGRFSISLKPRDQRQSDAVEIIHRLAQRQVSTIFTQLNLYRVILEVRPEDRSRPEALERIYVRAPSGDAVPLSAFAHYETKPIALSISHQGQFPSVTLSFNTAPGVSL